VLFGKRCRSVFLRNHGPQFVHGDIGEVAAGDLPLIVRFDDYRRGQPQKRGRVGENLDDISAASQFLPLPDLQMLLSGG
jgi:hypothetical protein